MTGEFIENVELGTGDVDVLVEYEGVWGDLEGLNMTVILTTVKRDPMNNGLLLDDKGDVVTEETDVGDLINQDLFDELFMRCMQDARERMIEANYGG